MPDAADPGATPDRPPPAGGAAEIDIDILTDADAWTAAPAGGSDCAALADRAVRAALADELSPCVRYEVSVLLTDDAAIADLNRQWRGKDGPTNVLSFPGDETDDAIAAAAGRPVLLGDVIVACETLVREAEAGGIPFANHFQHLIVHGTLHLLGYDHENDAEAEEMEARETEILAGLGVPDPYSPDASRPDADGQGAGESERDPGRERVG